MVLNTTVELLVVTSSVPVVKVQFVPPMLIMAGKVRVPDGLLMLTDGRLL